MTVRTPPTRRARRGSHRSSGLAAATLGVLGEILTTLGVLLALFIAWQLWWTDVVAEREQAALVRELGWVEPQGAAAQRVVAPDPAAGPPAAAPVPDEPAPGTTFAVLRVPRWGADYVRTISQGTDRAEVLDVLGIGHYEGTAMPGGVGNFAVAGHRTTYGKPFHRIADLEVGDPLVVQTQQTWYVYTVTATQVVRPEDVEVIAPVPGDPGATPTTALMTLTTCHPMYSARERYVVHAELRSWTPVADGVPAELGPLPGAA